MIPKKIHYCWFGGNPLPELAKKCIESWKKYCPDYEIIEWNETNFDINYCAYVKEAYEAKKWAFVSDYARFWILYHYGGIYLDTDVEVLKPLDDLPDTFVGFEKKTTVASGLIRGALKGDELCAEMLQSYHADKFVNEKGELNLTTVCERETDILEKYGLQRNGEIQTIKGTTVFPIDYFCPKDPETKVLTITKNTHTIHHFDGSWLTEEDKLFLKLKGKYRKFLPNKIAGLFAKFNAIKKCRGFKVAVKETFKWLKK